MYYRENGVVVSSGSVVEGFKHLNGNSKAGFYLSIGIGAGTLIFAVIVVILVMRKKKR